MPWTRCRGPLRGSFPGQPARRSLRPLEERPGSGLNPSLASWVRIERGPHRGWARRQLDHPGLEHRGHLMRTALGLGALVGQGGHASVAIAAEPRVHRLAAHRVAAGHVGHAHPVEDVDHRPIALYHQLELHQYGRLLRICRLPRQQRRRWQPPRGGPSQARSVKQVPEPVSPWYRNRVLKCQAGTGATLSSMKWNFTKRLGIARQIVGTDELP